MSVSSVMKYVFLVTNTLMVIEAGIFVVCAILFESFEFFGVMSAVLLLLAILGYFVFYKGSIWLVNLYATVISAFAITSLFFICLSVIEVPTIIFDTRLAFNSYWEEERDEPGSINELQRIAKCCGYYSDKDYQNYFHRPIPDSCYDSKNNLYTSGCYTVLEDSVTNFYDKVNYMLWSAFILKTVSSSLAWCLVMVFSKQATT